MKPVTKSIWNPARLDVRSFAKAEQTLEGPSEAGSFERLHAELMPDGTSPSLVEWQLHGENRADARGEAVPWLHIVASTQLPLPCQRCLSPVMTVLEVDRWYRFVADEVAAELEDEDSEEDVLALEPRPSVLSLLEDELLMAMPLVPMHDVCPVEVIMQAGEFSPQAVDAPSPEKPFAQLSRLRR